MNDNQTSTILQPSTGDEVQFNFRGEILYGTVLAQKLRSRGRKLTNRLGLAPIQIPVVQIAGFEKGIATVSPSQVTKILGKGDFNEARAFQAKIKSAHAERRVKRQESNYVAQEANGLSSLKPGAKILVQYNDGSKRERAFLRFTSSGSVVYSQQGRERTTPARFVALFPPSNL